MDKKIVVFIVFIGFILFTFFLFFYLYKENKKSPSYINLKINNKTYKLETAKTISERSRGLSNRNELCSNCGMVFFAKSDSIQPFWMKNTLIPLDMVWVNSEGRVVHIEQATIEEDPKNPQKIYRNATPAKYVIELNYKETEKLNLKIGDIINLANLND